MGGVTPLLGVRVNLSFLKLVRSWSAMPRSLYRSYSSPPGFVIRTNRAFAMHLRRLSRRQSDIVTLYLKQIDCLLVGRWVDVC